VVKTFFVLTRVKYLLFLHILGVVVWVGGMFFAYMALRPAAAQLLEPPQRLPLWAATLQRFFAWVWLAVALILLSGIGMIFVYGGFGAVRWHVHAMFALGVVMMAIFVHVYFAPFARLRHHVATQEWKSAGAALSQIRMLVGSNLPLGLATIAVALSGRVG
jgi:uncharacterized membrane protein